MDFEEIKEESKKVNQRKNRITMIALFAIFIVPVGYAYLAYFNGWIQGASQNKGELLVESEVLDVEDFRLVRANGEAITGEEFETLYWWLMPIENNLCDAACLDLNLYMLNQTYIGLGKETQRINPLLILPTGTQADTKQFPLAYSPFTVNGVKALEKTRSGLNKDLPPNFIYLVDPLGNIFMRYPLANNKEEAQKISKDLRTDVKRLFKFSRLG